MLYLVLVIYFSNAVKCSMIKTRDLFRIEIVNPITDEIKLTRLYSSLISS